MVFASCTGSSSEGTKSNLLCLMTIYVCQVGTSYSIQSSTVDCNCKTHESEHHTFFFYEFCNNII